MKAFLFIIFTIWFVCCFCSNNQSKKHFENSLERSLLKDDSLPRSNYSECQKTNDDAFIKLDAKISENERKQSDDVFEFINQVASIPPIIENILKHLNYIFYYTGYSYNNLEIRGSDYNGKVEVLQYWLRIICQFSVKELTIKWFHIDSTLGFEFFSLINQQKNHLKTLIFENCNFSSDSTKSLQSFKSLRVFKILNCSISEDDLDRFILSLPETLTHLNLCGIRWDSEKVNLKFSSFEKLNKLNELFLDDMLLENDEIITKLSFFQQLTTLSLDMNELNAKSFPVLENLESLSEICLSEDLMNNLFSLNMLNSTFPGSLKKVNTHESFPSVMTINSFSEKFKNIIFDCKLGYGYDVFVNFRMLFHLTSHCIDIDKFDSFNRFINNLNRESEKESFSLNHIKRIDFFGNLTQENLPFIS